MIHPKHNRINYGEQLVPPEGYELVKAIGTTYSLDLETLMVLPVALFYSKQLDCKVEDLRYDMLDAITKAADKITVYYQSSQLKVPRKYHHLMSFWENGIQPITMPDHQSSFHPKVWVIRYESKEALPIYRVLITSRNLTFSRDWDLAFSTEGIVTDKEQVKNKPLVHFLQYLNVSGKKKINASFINELLKVKFDILNKFATCDFVPIGIPNPETKKKYTNPITNANTKWDNMLIVSPFVDKTTLKHINEVTAKKNYLLSRKDELDSIDEETLKLFNCWQFSTFFQEAEYYQELEEEGVEPLAQNLHAKFFVTLRNKIPYWFLGSANCTLPAQGHNIEFMVKLKGMSSAGLKPKDIFNLLTDPSKLDDISLFTPYSFESRVSVEEKHKVDLLIRKIKYDLSKMPINGKATIIEGGTAFNLSIEIDARDLTIPDKYQVKVKPLPEKQKDLVPLIAGEINNIINFNSYAETALSIFLIFEIHIDGYPYNEFLLPMNIDLPNSRYNKIFTSIINSRDRFLEYITFLLTGEETNLVNNTSSDKNRFLSFISDHRIFNGKPLYEKLLIACSRFPEKIESIDALVNRLKEESKDWSEPIISPEFEDFWKVFQTFSNIKNIK